MKFPPMYKNVVAILENSNGGENPELWFETKTFNRETPIQEIIKWAYNRAHETEKNNTGRLVLSIDENIIQMPVETKKPETEVKQPAENKQSENNAQTAENMPPEDITQQLNPEPPIKPEDIMDNKNINNITIISQPPSQ